MKNHIVVAGGSGFIGSILTRAFVSGGSDVTVLTRSPGGTAQQIRQVGWDGRTLGDWARELEGARALVNLAGRSVNCRYNARNRREILESRVDSTRVLGEAIVGCKTPPGVSRPHAVWPGRFDSWWETAHFLDPRRRFLPGCGVVD